MDRWKESARAQFDSWSRGFDRSVLQRLFFGPTHDLFFERIAVRPGARILDVGCGTARFGARLLAQFNSASYVGLDLSEKMLRRARDNTRSFGDRAQFLVGDAEAIPLRDQSFDIVVCMHSFHHYPNKARAVAELRRVARLGGDIVLVDGDRDGWWGWLVFDGIVEAIERTVHHCSAEEFRDLVGRAELDLANQVRSGGVAPFLLTHAVRGREASPRRAARRLPRFLAISAPVAVADAATMDDDSR